MTIPPFAEWNPLLQALAGTLFTWSITALGAAVVFLTKEFNQRILDVMLGFAGGVMIAASYWSLLAPAIEMAENGPLPAWVPAATGFLLGGAFLRLIDRYMPHIHPITEVKEGMETTWRRTTLLVLAITLHNFPEGLAVGVAFGAVAYGLPTATLSGAIALALGIGIQDFPEGVAVALPLRREGLSRWQSFWYGQLSGAVEIVAGLIGAWAVLAVQTILPYALAFAAGAMIFVVTEDLIPEAQQGGHADQATIGLLLGFTLMMVLDVALG